MKSVEPLDLLCTLAIICGTNNVDNNINTVQHSTCTWCSQIPSFVDYIYTACFLMIQALLHFEPTCTDLKEKLDIGPSQCDIVEFGYYCASN